MQAARLEESNQQSVIQKGCPIVQSRTDGPLPLIQRIGFFSGAIGQFVLSAAIVSAF
ncbi:hypothetical protein B4135_0456 [Caldibacillus debilis]|uniref:Uncharacterized protein n=1 Tax=Caldibacillus debilis TaxID=301148 RepID=A0A150L902_9BACI|nr:hypothetical protein B4135_0456 [Caldibacillus debilis]